mgnify:CR=1 FL=1
MKVTKSQLIELLMNHRNGANTVSLHVVVDVPMNKSPFPPIKKEEWVTGMIQFNWKKAIENQQKREGLVPNYKKGTSWHHVVLKGNEKLSPFSMHKDVGEVAYLRIRKQNWYGTSYFDEDGHDINYEDIKPYLKKSEDDSHDLRNPPKFRVYSLDSIIDVKIDGQIYTLRQVA